MSDNLVTYAESELRRAGLFDKDNDYGRMLGESCLAIIKVFSKQGHSGFSAELTTRIAAEHNNDYTYARERVEAFERACLILALNLNEFVYRNCANAAVLQRVLFHEALEGGMSIPDALQHAKTAKFIPCGKSDVERELNRQERLQAAKERWGEGSEIIESLSGKRGYSFEVNPIHP